MTSQNDLTNRIEGDTALIARKVNFLFLFLNCGISTGKPTLIKDLIKNIRIKDYFNIKVR